MGKEKTPLQKSYEKKLVNFRVAKKIHEEYKMLCDDTATTLSKRLRKLMLNDLENWKRQKYKNMQGL